MSISWMGWKSWNGDGEHFLIISHQEQPIYANKYRSLDDLIVDLDIQLALLRGAGLGDKGHPSSGNPVGPQG